METARCISVPGCIAAIRQKGWRGKFCRQNFRSGGKWLGRKLAPVLMESDAVISSTLKQVWIYM